MSHILERRKLLLEDAEGCYRELFKIRIRELEDKYRRIENRRSVIEAFADLARSWNDHRDKKAASLGICILYSSVVRRTYEYRLILSGEEFLLDKEAIETLWIPNCFFDDFEKDMQYIIGQLKHTYPRLCSSEEDAIRFQCVEYVHTVVYKLCVDLINEILEEAAFIQLKKTDHFFVYFSKYRGEGEVICRIETDADSSQSKTERAMPNAEAGG